jgi:hypothetical protein
LPPVRNCADDSSSQNSSMFYFTLYVKGSFQTEPSLRLGMTTVIELTWGRGCMRRDSSLRSGCHAGWAPGPHAESACGAPSHKLRADPSVRLGMTTVIELTCGRGCMRRDSSLRSECYAGWAPDPHAESACGAPSKPRPSHQKVTGSQNVEGLCLEDELTPRAGRSRLGRPKGLGGRK